jgi:hypothetical protein
VPEVHQAVGGVVILLNLVAGLWGVAIYRGRLTAGRAFEQVLALSHTVVVGQTVLGLLLLGSRHKAPTQLHYLYGAAPALAILYAYASRSDDPRRNTLVFSVIAVFVALIGSRAFMTGKGWP